MALINELRILVFSAILVKEFVAGPGRRMGKGTVEGKVTGNSIALSDAGLFQLVPGFAQKPTETAHYLCKSGFCTKLRPAKDSQNRLLPAFTLAPIPVTSFKTISSEC